MAITRLLTPMVMVITIVIPGIFVSNWPACARIYVGVGVRVCMHVCVYVCVCMRMCLRELKSEIRLFDKRNLGNTSL